MAKWTEEEDRILVDSLRAGIQIVNIDLPRRPEFSRYQRLKRLHLDTRGNSVSSNLDCRRVLWSAAESAALVAQLKEGVKPGAVQIQGKTKDAVEQHLRWDRPLFCSLVQQLASGSSVARLKIAGKTREEIRVKLYAMGLDPDALRPKELRIPERGPWSVEETAWLRAQLQQSMHISAVTIEGRSSTAIEARARQLRLITTSTWSDLELAELRQQLEAGASIDTVTITRQSNRQRRNRNAIRAQATRLGLIGDGIARKAWAKHEINFLILATKRNMPLSVLIGALKKTKDSVAQMKRRLKKQGRI